jgi:hypothetical protein
VNALEQAINEIDLEKIRDVMLYLDWRWVTVKDTPTVDDMKACIYRLYNSFDHLPADTESVASGGFRVVRGETFVRVSFEVDSGYGRKTL